MMQMTQTMKKRQMLQTICVQMKKMRQMIGTLIASGVNER